MRVIPVRVRLTLLGISAVLLAAAPATHAATRDHPAPTRRLTVTAADSATSPLDHGDPGFRLSLRSRQAIAAGVVRVTLVNTSRALNHQATLARLHRGVSLRRFVATAHAHGDLAALRLVDLAGGPGTTAPGARQTTWQRLAPGRYVVMCLVDTPDGTSHLDLGMLSSFRVVRTRHAGAAPTARSQGTITARTTGSTMTFDLPAGFTGNGLYRFRNAAADDNHELAIVRLSPGRTAQDVINWFKQPGPPPFTAAGGFSAVAPHGRGWVELHLAPGNYVATCFVPDDAGSHQPHGELGMDVAFTVP